MKAKQTSQLHLYLTQGQDWKKKKKTLSEFISLKIFIAFIQACYWRISSRLNGSVNRSSLLLLLSFVTEETDLVCQCFIHTKRQKGDEGKIEKAKSRIFLC